MEFRERVARVGLSGVLFALTACGGERKPSGEELSADTAVPGWSQPRWCGLEQRWRPARAPGSKGKSP